MKYPNDTLDFPFEEMEKNVFQILYHVRVVHNRELKMKFF